MAGEDSVKAMHAAGAQGEYLSAGQPLIRLIEELTERKECNQIYVRKPGLSLTLEKRKNS